MKLTIEQLKETTEYRDLTDKQKKFVEEYVSNGGNKLKATLAAYNCKSERIAQIFSHTVMGMRGVIFALGAYYNEDEEGKFANLLQSAILKGNLSDADVRAWTLLADVKGFSRRNPKTQNPDGTPANLKQYQPKPEPELVEVGAKKRVIDLTPKKGLLEEFND